VNLKTKIICSIVSVLYPAFAFAIDETLTTVDRDLNPFASSYIHMEYSQNFPVAYSEVFFEPGPRSPLIGYRFVRDSEWFMGVGVQFRMYKSRQDRENTTFPIFTFSQEAIRLFRVHHPVYMGAGYKLLYLGPAEKATFPIARDDEFESEIGVSINGNLIVVLKNKSFFSLFVDRWRGTKTQRLQGINTGIGFSYPL